MLKPPHTPDSNKDIFHEFLNYPNLLGEMGIQILKAICRGANQKESIMMFSGVPMICIKGRLPILLDLKLISQVESKHSKVEYLITELGSKFLTLIGQP